MLDNLIGKPEFTAEGLSVRCSCGAVMRIPVERRPKEGEATTATGRCACGTELELTWAGPRPETAWAVGRRQGPGLWETLKSWFRRKP